MRRKWIVRSRPYGEPPVTLLGEVIAARAEREPVATLVVEVTDAGNVVIDAAGMTPVELHPVHVEHLRRVLAHARATALWKRQRW